MTTTTTSAGTQLRDLGDDEFAARYRADRFTATVLSSRFEYIIDHVCAQLLTTAFSPIIRDFNDFSATLSAGPSLRYATPAVAKTLAVFYGSMRDAVANCVEEFGPARLAPGDLLICNDPYRNGTHVNDMCFMRPIFRSGELISVLTIRAHMMDIGGTVPGGFSGMKRNVYETGLVVPPTLLYSGDEPVRSTFSLILDNARFGSFLLPDIQTIHHALRLGETLIQETLDRYGEAAYEGAMRYACDASAESTRRALEAVPDGVYEGSDDIDCDGDDADTSYRVRVRITKRGSRAEVDFSGTSRQASTSLNAAWPDTKSTVAIALKFLLDPNTPFTSASTRDVDIVLPSGTITSAEPPDGAVMCYWEPLSSGFAAILRALQDALGPRALAGDSRAFLHDAVGTTEQGVPFVTTMNPCGGWGANAAGDADSGQLSYYMNYLDPTVESVEASAPVYVLRKEYLIDSAGSGRHRGGAGLLKDSYWPTPVEHHICVPKVKTPNGEGVFGGRDGGMAGVWLWHDRPLDGDATRLPARGDIFRSSEPVTGMIDPATHEPDPSGRYYHWGARTAWVADANAVMRFISCGGGGWGDPFERDPEDVLRDVRDGYVSVEAAAREYGVVVTGDVDRDPEGLSIDAGATAAARRRGRVDEPRERRDPPLAPPVEVAREPVDGRCGECGAAALARYPVLAEDGWYEAVKCQSCLASAGRTPWHRLGYLRLLEDDLETFR